MEEINLSTNLNPLGPPPWFANFLQGVEAALRAYQPLWHDALDDKLAAMWDMVPRTAFAIPGTSSFLYALPQLLDCLSTSCVLLRPTFWEYGEMAALNGWRVHALPAHDSSGRVAAADCDALDELLSRTRPGLALLCDPNNPTGDTLGRAAVERLASAHPGTTFLVDQTYAAFCADWHERRLPTTGGPPNIASLTSFSKLFCLPGLRIGVVAFADPARAERVKRRLGPVRLDALAAEALPLLLADADFIARTARYVADEWVSLSAALAGFDQLQVRPSETLFRFIRVDGPASAEETGGTWLAGELRKRGIRVLDGAVYGAPAYIRLRLGSRGANARLLQALQETLR